jgi:hypothetical protein
MSRVVLPAACSSAGGQVRVDVVAITQLALGILDSNSQGILLQESRKQILVPLAIESVTHVTMPANELMYEIHNTGSNPQRVPERNDLLRSGLASARDLAIHGACRSRADTPV